MPPSPSLSSDNDEDYFLAPQDQRPFGAGIKRKHIAFIPASSDFEPTTPSTPRPNTNAGARYLSIVLGQDGVRSKSEPPLGGSGPNATEDCAVCGLPVTTSLRDHESSIAHQVSLEHSHPPSHLDRQRKGLKYLEGYGWDPDSRLGLGARSEGIRMPVKAREKRDTAGLGLLTARDQDGEMDGQVGGLKKLKRRLDEIEAVPKKRLDAKQVRKMDDEKRKKADKLRSVFYGDDLSRYLGPGG